MSKDAGKGDAPRPFRIDRKTYEQNWDTTFKKKEEEDVSSRKERKN